VAHAAQHPVHAVATLAATASAPVADTPRTPAASDRTTA